jgi:hypothetical protein
VRVEFIFYLILMLMKWLLMLIMVHTSLYSNYVNCVVYFKSYLREVWVMREVSLEGLLMPQLSKPLLTKKYIGASSL